MKALVTGASGFVGSAVARQILKQGHDVKVLLRPSSDKRNIDDIDVEVAVGDLNDSESLLRALSGCQALFHVAADYRLWALNPRELYDNNVTGTRNIMQAALQTGVERTVYTSSVATLGLHKDASPANEDSPVSLADMIGDYKRSKYMAEEIVKEMVREQGLPAVIVNPSTPVGPRDIKPTPTGRMILDAACGRVPAYVDTGLNVAHVDDVAYGHWLAYEYGQTGERYILGGENMTLCDIYTIVARLVDKKPPKIRLPHNLILPIAYISEVWARLTRGREPRVTVDAIRLAKKFMYFSIEKAERELHYHPRPAEQALADAVHWFTEEEYCK